MLDRQITKAPNAKQFGDSREEGETEKPFTYQEEGLSMNTSVTEKPFDVVMDVRLDSLELDGFQASIKHRLEASPLTLNEIASRALMPHVVLSFKLAQTNCAFTLREIANLAKAIGLEPSELIAPIFEEAL